MKTSYAESKSGFNHQRNPKCNITRKPYATVYILSVTTTNQLCILSYFFLIHYTVPYVTSGTSFEHQCNPKFNTYSHISNSITMSPILKILKAKA